jgi:hypothetical protein
MLANAQGYVEIAAALDAFGYDVKRGIKSPPYSRHPYLLPPGNIFSFDPR